MIQRIQTVFYFLAALSLGGLFQFPFATSEKPVPMLLDDQVYNVMDHIVLTALAAIGALVALVAIFLFRNRPLQIKMGYIVIIVSILTPLVAFLLMYNENTVTKDTSVINDSFGLYLPVFALLFGLLANRFVKKDEKTVRSMDRLR